MGLGFLLMVRVKSITRDELSDPNNYGKSMQANDGLESGAEKSGGRKKF